MKPRYTHLHVHSHYSLLDGVITIPNLVRAAKERGMKALALTDHGNMFGAVEFYKRAREEGIKPIIGMEAYITEGSRLEKKRGGPAGNTHHLVLLARNETGYRNLLKLTSTAFVDGFYYKPRIDHEVLARHAEGLIGLSACLSSEVNRALAAGDDERALAAAARYQRIFGRDGFFLEIQDHGLPEQRRVLEKAPALAQRLGLKLVATNDIHYLNPSDSRAQEIHLCINTGATLDDADRLAFDTDQFHFRTTEEMARVFADWPEAVSNSDDIAGLIELELEMDKPHLPRFRPAGERTGDAGEPEALRETENRRLFRRLCEEGFARRYPDPAPEVRARLEQEIEVIEATGYVSYFLITWDFIRFAREEGIPVGPGRGSAVGSIVAYCLGITSLDPIRYDLLFERFLNSDRISMPDIDIDFCMEGRDKVIRYVRERYGEDRVCQIVTFGTMAARAVIRDVGRALNIPLKDVDAIAKKIPESLGMTLEKAIEQVPELAQLAKDPRYEELFRVAPRLEGLNRHCSTHAAGVVIADRPLTDIVPLYRNGEDITTQYTMEDLESIGLLKMDFLGLRTLTIIQRALEIIREEKGIAIDIDRLPLDDPATFRLLAAGNTRGIFQLESHGMRTLLRRLLPDRFEELIAVLALFRPGPLGSGMDRIFCERKHGREQVSYLHSALEPLLRETNGVILYQEQVMRIAHDLAGFSMNEADLLRKAMGKKRPEIMARYTSQFVAGARERGIPERVAREIFEQIEHFAKYGFNKSHSTAYALISYQTAWLKANHPAAFLAAVLSCEIGNVDHLVEVLDECRQLRIPVHPPHIGTSGRNFSVRGGEIHYGLVALKGVGEKAVESIVAEREAGGPFRSLFDLAARVDLRVVNKAVLEQLVRSGALDSIGPSRPALMAAVKDALEDGSRIQAERRAGQLSLFGDDAAGVGSVPAERYPVVPPWSELEVLAAEKESLGYYLSGHPLGKHEQDIAPFRTHRVNELALAEDRTAVVVGVRIAKVRVRQTKRGDTMAVLVVEDQTGSVEVVVFPSLFRTESGVLREESAVLIAGTVDVQENARSLRAEQIVAVDEAFSRLGKRIGIEIPVEAASEDLLGRLKRLVARHPGGTPLSLVFCSPAGERWVVRTGEGHGIAPTSDLLSELRALVGEEHVLVNRA